MVLTIVGNQCPTLSQVNDEYTPLVELFLTTTDQWVTETKGSFHITLNEGFQVTEKEDWIGLYEVRPSMLLFARILNLSYTVN